MTENNNQKILTVSVAAFNASSTLHEALDPFTKISRTDLLDVIIVNDGSTDDTEMIAREYADRLPGVFRVLNKENGGWGSTLNASIPVARGKYFKQLDADDYFEKSNLDHFLLFLENCNADYVFCPHIRFEDRTDGKKRVYGGEISSAYQKKQEMLIDSLDDFRPNMHSATIRSDVLQKEHVHVTEHCFYTDTEFVCKAFLASRTMAFYPDVIYCYRLGLNGQSISTEGIKKHYQDHIKMLKNILALYRSTHQNTARHRILKKTVLDDIKCQYRFFFLIDKTAQHRKELMDFDHWLRKSYSELYHNHYGIAISILRLTGFHGYAPVSVMAILIDHMKTVIGGC